MKKLNLKRQEKEKSNFFGMSLPSRKEAFLKRRLEDLAERCPSSSNLNLKLEQKESCIKGTLIINSFSEKFYSTKVATDPIQTYFLLQEDIEAQLLEWKRKRFSDSLFKQLKTNTRFTENCA